MVDIILRSKGTSLGEGWFGVVVASNVVDATGRQEYSWEDPSAAFSEEERASEDAFQEKFQLELFDAAGGGLICRLVWFV